MASSIDDDWLDYCLDPSMFNFVSPNDICPLNHPLVDSRSHHFDQNLQLLNQPQSQAQSQHQPHQHQQFSTYQQETIIQQKPETHQIQLQLQFDQLQSQQLQQQQHQNQHQQPQNQYQQQQEQPNIHEKQSDNVLVINNQQGFGPPPVLVAKDEHKFVSIQQQLDYQKALSQQRQEELKARLDNEPLRLPPKILRKPTGKKLTGRERQLELERVERNLLQQKERYLDLIAKLELKCSKLREILENIVTNSPEYNNQMINCLEADGLLIDSHIN